jgi:hypothetical protein
LLRAGKPVHCAAADDRYGCRIWSLHGMDYSDSQGTAFYCNLDGSLLHTRVGLHHQPDLCNH